MSNVLKDITNQFETDKSSELFEKEDVVNQKTNVFLNNLDDLDENIGAFNIKIFGVGGAGCNVVEHMMNSRTWPVNVSLYALNTDVQALKRIAGLTNVCLLGKKTLRGAGSGGEPTIGKIAVEENIQDIKDVLKGTDILFIVAGLGKGTGSGASPEIAKIAKEMGILTVAIVNFPSINAQGRTIYENALNSFGVLKDQVNSITRISNDKIITNSKNIAFVKAFELANIAITSTVSDIVDMVNNGSSMNLDFADISNFFKNHATFMSGTFSIGNDYTKETLKTTIVNSVKDSFSDVNIKSENVKVMVNMQINSATPVSFPIDVRNVFKEMTQNNGLSLVQGIDTVSTENIKASYLISADNNIDKVEEININEYKTDMATMEIDDPLSIDETINIASVKTEDIPQETGGVKHETISFDTTELDKEEGKFNSRDIASILTKAINGVVDSNSELDSIEATKKYN